MFRINVSLFHFGCSAGRSPQLPARFEDRVDVFIAVLFAPPAVRQVDDFARPGDGA